MLSRLADGVKHIYRACGHTGFRRQIDGMSAMVSLKFKLDLYLPSAVFIFCNKKRNTIKVLRWDKNGFVLVTKKVMHQMCVQWPQKPDEVIDINHQALRWLLEGLQIDQSKAFQFTCTCSYMYIKLYLKSVQNLLNNV